MRCFYPFLLLVASFSSVSISSEGQAELPPLREWTFLFVAGLDNDLDPWAGDLERSLCSRVIDDMVAVTVLEDRRGTEGLHRCSITADGFRKDVLPTEDSTSPEVLYEYLRWTSSRFPARRYVVTLFGHGGRLDEMCRDDHPTGSMRDGPRWIRTVVVGDVLRRWRGELEQGQIELLFLQECGRASVEELYSLRDTATFILASQAIVFAGRSDYSSVLTRAVSDPRCDGADLGRLLMDMGKADVSYALVDGGQLGELPERLVPLIDHLGFDPPCGTHGRWPGSPCFYHDDECAYDLRTSLASISPDDDEEWDRRLEDFMGWVERDLVVHSSVRCRSGELCDPTWCGLSIFLPSSREIFVRHAVLPIYRDCRWGDVVQR